MDPLELFLLDTGTEVVALARRESDVVIERLAFDGTLRQLSQFRRRVEDAVLGNGERPKASELRDFGDRLFKWVFRGKLRDLYGLLPSGNITLQVLSTRPELLDLPWEYIQTPDHQPAPHRKRRVVRILPTCGVRPPEAPVRPSKMRVLFAVADPIDQQGLQWEHVQRRMKHAFESQLPAQVELKVVEGATRAGLVKLIREEAFDVFHFFGHGQLRSGEGHLVLTNVKTQRSDLLSGAELAMLLSGKQVRLAILSACLSSAGKADDDFSTVATALVRSGVPAVVANQLSIPEQSVAPFVGVLYGELLRTGNIDDAVMEGRVVLALGLDHATGTDATLEWGIPTLYRIANGAQLFQP
jgi:hypothetical protein